MSGLSSSLGTYVQYITSGNSELILWIGRIAFAYICFKLLSKVIQRVLLFIRSFFGTNLKNVGGWAVVTGATDGIGKAYAEALAASGFNLILISRTRKKLEDLAEAIHQNTHVQTKVVAVDFTSTEIYNTIRNEISDIPIGVLVNNVGMSYDYPMYFHEIEEDRTVHDLINVNMLSMTMMTKICLPVLLKRGKGVIINVASASALSPTPLLTEYSASKAYVDTFSRALHEEVASKGVYVQSVLPFFVATKLSKIRRGNFFAPNPDTYVSEALATVFREPRTVGCFAHKIQEFLTGLLPGWLVSLVTFSTLNSARVRGMRKAQKRN